MLRALARPIARLLAFIGRHGPLAFALSIFIGLALPQLAAAMRPILPVTIFLFVMLNFARADGENLRQALSQPGRFSTAVAWSFLAQPLLFLAVFAVVPRGSVDAELLLGLALYCAAPPLMASPAYAQLLGFRNGLVTALLFLAMAVTPFLSPWLATLLAGREVPIDVSVLMVRLFGLVGGAILCGMLLRRFVGEARLEANRHEINGFGVVLFFLFAIAAMDGVIDLTLADPLRTVVYTVIAFALCTVGFLLTLLAGRWLNVDDRFGLALASGFRNMGLLVAALGALTPERTYLFFALMQFPIYMAPLLAQPVARWLLGQRAQTPGEAVPPLVHPPAPR
jgi:BASS family bile acid:Na+ symporter